MSVVARILGDPRTFTLKTIATPEEAILFLRDDDPLRSWVPALATADGGYRAQASAVWIDLSKAYLLEYGYDPIEETP